MRKKYQPKFLLLKLFVIIIIIFFSLFKTPLKETRLLSSFILLLYFPGFFLTTKFLKNLSLLELLFLPILLGFSLQVIIFYFFSLLGVRYHNHVLLTLMCSTLFFFSNTNITLKKIKTEYLSVLLLLFFINFFFAIYPDSEVAEMAFKEVGYFPPGDDSKHHILLIKGIVKEGKIPEFYYLYPQIRIYYPQGYHSIIASIIYLSKYDIFKIIFFIGVFFYCLSVFSFFYAGKIIFGERIGLISSLLSLTNLMFLKFITHGMYPNLIAAVLQPLIISTLFLYIKKDVSIILPSILLASSILISPYVGLISLLVTIFVIIKTRKTLCLLLLTILLLSPYICLLSKIFLQKQIRIESFSFISQIYTLPTFRRNIGYYLYTIFNIFVYLPLLFFAIISFFYLKSNTVKYIFIAWLLAPLVLILIRWFFIYFPFIQYIIFLEDFRVLSHLSLPIILLSSFYLGQNIKKSRNLIILLLLLTLLPLCMKIERHHEIKYQPFTFGDLAFITWIKNNIRNTSIIFNDYMKGTSSTWIPPLAEIKITSPFLMSSWEDRLYPTFQDHITVRIIPDSKEAMEILKKFNATHITFSTFFSNWDMEYLFPKFDIYKFKEPCYTKLYGKYYNYLFKINYENCSGDNYIKVYQINLSDLSADEIKIYFNLSDIKIDPILKKEIEPYLFIWFDSTSIGDIKIRYKSIEEAIPKRKIGSNLFQPIRLPTHFLDEKNPNIWLIDEPKIKNVSLVFRLDEVLKLKPDIFIYPKPSKVEERKVIINTTNPLKLILKDISPQKKLVIFFNDTKGNVDFNFYDDSWKSLYILERNRSNKIKSIEIPFNFSARLFFIDIVPRNSDFEILDIIIGDRKGIFKRIITEPVFIYLNKSKKIVKSLEDLHELPNITKISDKIYLQGEWEKTKEGIKVRKNNINSKILLFNVSEGILRISYLDRGKGNVDFNFYDSFENEWKEFYILRRNDSREICEIEFDVKLFNTRFLVLGVYAHEDDFVIRDITFTSR